MKKLFILLFCFVLSSIVCLAQENENDCGNLKPGSIVFVGRSIKLNAIAMANLKVLAKDMRANPNCVVVIQGSGTSSKLAQQNSWDRVNNTINHLVAKDGIDRERFIFMYNGNGNEDTVAFRAAQDGENGPNRLPPPFPNLRR